VNDACTRKCDCEGKLIKTANEIPAERRKVIRYRMSALSIFRWSSSRADHFQGEGVTRDVSVSGVHVAAETCPPARSILQMEIVLAHAPTVRPTRMKAKMTVLRVDNVAGEGRGGFSAVSSGFSLHTSLKHISEANAKSKTGIGPTGRSGV
jgi:hypothetical protein